MYLIVVVLVGPVFARLCRLDLPMDVLLWPRLVGFDSFRCRKTGTSLPAGVGPLLFLSPKGLEVEGSAGPAVAAVRTNFFFFGDCHDDHNCGHFAISMPLLEQ